MPRLEDIKRQLYAKDQPDGNQALLAAIQELIEALDKPDSTPEAIVEVRKLAESLDKRIDSQAEATNQVLESVVKVLTDRTEGDMSNVMARVDQISKSTPALLQALTEGLKTPDKPFPVVDYAVTHDRNGRISNVRATPLGD